MAAANLTAKKKFGFPNFSFAGMKEINASKFGFPIFQTFLLPFRG